ncbi:MAG: DAK2 domain-containing protein [Actinobacteria bacterium]|nr:DAK2 domain-containing protein [Actinomycetota bacterium]
MGVEFLDGQLFKRMILSATDLLEKNKSNVDALNVFPVPDGDTGTNMSMTLASASREVQKTRGTSISEVAEACAMGSLLGARGNSGVILSQLFRGFARGVEGKKKIGPAELGWAFQEGVKTAYKAVMKPVEGTILTVARESARAAMAAARRGEGILVVMEEACAQAEVSLAQTPEMLAILKKAGVVDSGGKGLTCILNGYLEALRGAEAGRKDISPAKTVEFAITKEMGDIRFPYDTEFLVRGKGLPLSGIRETLSAWGDCLLVVGTEELAKIHVHTDNPGRVLDYCVRQGELIQIEIKNMREQHEDLKATTLTIGQEGASRNAARAEGPADAAEGPQLAVVAVVAGDGLAEIFRSLGVSEVVQGGQTMNPSTEDLISAVHRTGARQVVILPNNKNIILAAEQARALSKDREVSVVPTRSIPQGIAAMLSWQPEIDAAKNVEAMSRAMTGVKTGEVTYAVRDTKIGELSISKGDVLGLEDGEIKVTGRDPGAVMTDLLGAMVETGGEIVTIYYGEGIEEERAAVLVDGLKPAYPDREIELHYGGQPLYYYIFSVE